MSDDRLQNPMPAESWVSDRIAKLRSDSDLTDARCDQTSTANTLDAIAEVARRQAEAFTRLPCRGLVEHIGECSDAFALTCERRTSPSCPREISAFDQAREREELVAMFRAANVPRDSADAVLDGFHPTDATQAVDRFLVDPQARTLVLAGSVGVGKSVAAAYAMSRRKGFCRFVSASSLPDISRFDEAAMREKRLAYDCSLLVLDDLGTEYGDAKGWFHSVLEPLLVDRHGNKRRTIITCNLPTEAFVQRYGERIADRIAGSGMFVRFGGPSLRVRK